MFSSHEPETNAVVAFWLESFLFHFLFDFGCLFGFLFMFGFVFVSILVGCLGTEEWPVPALHPSTCLMGMDGFSVRRAWGEGWHYATQSKQGRGAERAAIHQQVAGLLIMFHSFAHRYNTT